VHVTLRVRASVPSLRSARVFPFVRAGLAAAHKAAFRVIQFSVQSEHLHLIVEGDDPVALVRGVQGLAVRCAKAINRAVLRRGGVWSHRYHSRALRNPTEMRHGLVYVLLNHRKHLRAAPGIDPRSSGRWFDGWQRSTPSPSGRIARPSAPSATAPSNDPSPVAPPTTWLAAVGWRRAGGALAFDELPRGGRSPPVGAHHRAIRR
jgi:REP element-mobilizing transposase RayT